MIFLHESDLLFARLDQIGACGVHIFQTNMLTRFKQTRIRQSSPGRPLILFEPLKRRLSVRHSVMRFPIISLKGGVFHTLRNNGFLSVRDVFRTGGGGVVGDPV